MLQPLARRARFLTPLFHPLFPHRARFVSGVDGGRLRGRQGARRPGQGPGGDRPAAAAHLPAGRRADRCVSCVLFATRPRQTAGMGAHQCQWVAGGGGVVNRERRGALAAPRAAVHARPTLPASRARWVRVCGRGRRRWRCVWLWLRLGRRTDGAGRWRSSARAFQPATAVRMRARPHAHARRDQRAAPQASATPLPQRLRGSPRPVAAQGAVCRRGRPMHAFHTCGRGAWRASRACVRACARAHARALACRLLAHVGCCARAQTLYAASSLSPSRRAPLSLTRGKAPSRPTDRPAGWPAAPRCAALRCAALRVCAPTSTPPPLACSAG